MLHTCIYSSLTTVSVLGRIGEGLLFFILYLSIYLTVSVLINEAIFIQINWFW